MGFGMINPGKGKTSIKEEEGGQGEARGDGGKSYSWGLKGISVLLRAAVD